MRAIAFALVTLAVTVNSAALTRRASVGSLAMSANGDHAGIMSSASNGIDFNANPYAAPGANDCRSPCPALNTLANHGLLPRDGKNIDYNQLKQALIGVYNLGDAFGFVFARAATKKFANPATGTFSLCDLLINIHNSAQASQANGIEHSASLTREDRPAGDFTHKTDVTQRVPNASQYSIVLNSAGKDGIISTADFMTARKSLWDKSYRKNPALKRDKLVTQEHIIADVEGCLLLGALSGNSNAGKFQISQAYAKSFLADEKFPAGWQKSATSLGFPQLLQCLAGEGYAWAKNEFTGLIELGKHWFGVN